MNPYFESRRTPPGQPECHQSGTWDKLYVPPHYHDYIELNYINSGSMQVQIGSHICEMASGDLAVFGSRQVHSTRLFKEKPTFFTVIKFEPEMLNSPFFEMRYVIQLTKPSFESQQIFHTKEEKTLDIERLIKTILDESNKKDYGYDLAIRGALDNLFVWIIRSGYSPDLRKHLQRLYTSPGFTRMQGVLQYIASNYCEDLTVETLAQQSNLSYSYFSRLFHRVTGRTFKEYLNLVRLSEAEKLLLTTDKSITDVATSCGFNSSSYFIRQFRNLQNRSPEKYKLEKLEANKMPMR